MNESPSDLLGSCETAPGSARVAEMATETRQGQQRRGKAPSDSFVYFAYVAKSGGVPYCKAHVIFIQSVLRFYTQTSECPTYS